MQSGERCPDTSTAVGGAGLRQPRRVLVGLVVGVLVATASYGASGQEDTTTTTTTTTSAETTASTTATTATSTTVADPGSTASQSTSTTVSEATSSTESAPSSPSSSAANTAERQRAVTNLNLAKAADEEIARSLNEINQAANTTMEKVDEANAKIEAADAILARTTEELERSGTRQSEIETDLRIKAIEGFKTRSLGEINPILTDMDVTRAIRQHGLLAQASLSTAELLEELRGLLEERRLANAEAAQAKAEAEAAHEVLAQELERLKEQQNAQLQLKAEAERRIDVWAAELNAYAREDAAIQQVIVQNSKKAEVETVVNQPTTASTSGFQWPIAAKVTSEYGYRVHPVYGTRRLHSGMDIGAAGGTPIAASNGGVVIFAGRQGGYGNTIIIDHGGGISTLYAHQSRLGASVGQLVNRGDIIGFVGRTGTATGNHLHFEVRVNGTATNPRNYLP